MVTLSFPRRDVLELAAVGMILAVSSCGAAPPDPTASAGVVTSLEAWLAQSRADRPALVQASFAQTALTKQDAERAKALLWEDHAAFIRTTRVEEMKARRIELDGRVMRFDWRTTGDRPTTGFSLFISLHGGGNTSTEVNDKQWANQLRLGDSYRPKEGIYLAPRAPTDSWNLWHEKHIDALIDRLIQNFIVLEGVNPDRVYLLGYSAGGDGVYQLAPRIADRLAAASMMAGHPNEASPLGLRNIGFALHVGALDADYRRNEVGREWGGRLGALRASDPHGYAHQVEIHEGKRHWMELEDRVAIPWMEQFTRNPLPDTVVWHQDDVVHGRFYWLEVDPTLAMAGDDIVARRDGSTISLQSSRPMAISLLLDDSLLDLDSPVTVTDSAGKLLSTGQPTRTLATLHDTLASRGQRPLMAPARLEVRVPANPNSKE